MRIGMYTRRRENTYVPRVHSVLLLRYAQTGGPEETAKGRERRGKGADSRKKDLSTIRLRSGGTPLKLFTDKHMRFPLSFHFVFRNGRENEFLRSNAGKERKNEFS